MKLNFGKRLILFLHWLISLAGCVIALLYCLNPNIMWDAFGIVYNKIGKRQTDIIGMACLAVYVIFSIATVMIIFSNRQKREERCFIVVDSSETGRTRVAVSAVEQMIRQSVRGMEEIKTMKTAITNHGDSISVDADVVIADQTHVPSVAASIQRSVRSYIELNCGVTVREISVNVRSLEQIGEKGKHSKKNAEFEAKPPVLEPEPLKEVTPEYCVDSEPEYAVTENTEADADDISAADDQE